MLPMPDYGRFCPVALGSEVLADRWTPLIVRELILGNTRFNDIARGLPGHLPVAARPAPAPPRAQGRRRALAVAHRPGQRVPPHPGRQGPRGRGRRPRSLGGRVAVRRSAPARGRPRQPDVVDAPAHRRGASCRPARVVIEFDHTAPDAHGDLDGARPRRGIGVPPAPRLRPRPRGHHDHAGAGRGVRGARHLVPRARRGRHPNRRTTRRSAKRLPRWFLWSPFADVTREMAAATRRGA